MTRGSHTRTDTVKNWLGAIVLLLIGVGFSALPMWSAWSKPGANKDYSRWWNAAMDVRQGASLQLTGGEQSFIYPPASAVVFYTPLSFLGQAGMVLALCVLCLAAHACVVLISVYYATGRCLNQHPLLYIVPVLATLGYVWDIYFLGQPNLIMLAVMMPAFLLLDRHRLRPAAWAGALLGAVTVAKAFPATVLGILVWRRHWMAALTMILVAAALLFAAPGPVRGFATNAKETWVWIDRMLLSTSGEQLANQPDRAFRSGNQSMMSVTHRLMRDVEAAGGGDEPSVRVNVVSTSSTAAFAVFAVMAGALCLAFVTGMPARAEQTRRSRGLEYAVLLIFITIFSPKAGTYYYCWLLPGLTMIVGEVLRAPHGSVRRRVLTAGLVVALALMSSALLQAVGVFEPQAVGVTFWGGLIVVVMLLWSMHALKREIAQGRGETDELGDLAPFAGPVSGPAAGPREVPA